MFKKIQFEVNILEDYINIHSRNSDDNVFVLFTHLLAECGEAADEVKELRILQTILQRIWPKSLLIYYLIFSEFQGSITLIWTTISQIESKRYIRNLNNIRLQQDFQLNILFHQ
jgi:hypothetical protein